MSVLKQCDAADRVSIIRTASEPGRAPANKADPLEIAAKSPRAELPTFAEDFTREHSLRHPQVTPIAMAGNF